MYSNRPLRMVICLLSWLLLTYVSVFAKDQPDTTHVHRDLLQNFATLQAELAATTDSQPYLVLDLPRLQVQVRMAGVVVWRAEIRVETEDSDSAAEFADHFSEHGMRPARAISDRHLFTATGQTSDSVLAIVGTTLKVSPDSLQRQVPQRFRLFWPGGLVLTVLTDVAGKPHSRVGNVLADLSYLAAQPFREAELTVRMAPESAITLYRVSHEGMTTIVIGPETPGESSR